jgi:hypothetical protein
VSLKSCLITIFVVAFFPSNLFAQFHHWSNSFGDTLTQFGNAVTTDRSRNVLLTGGFEGTVNFGGGALTSAGLQDIHVAKFDPNGGHLWSQSFGDGQGQVGTSIATDYTGNVFITGSFVGTVNFGGAPLTSAGGDDIFIAKFSPAGTHLWSKSFGEMSAELSTSIIADSLANVWITGVFADSVNFGGGMLSSAGGLDIFVAKFDLTGAHLWSKRFGDPSEEWSSCIDTDGSGNAHITGSFDGSVNFGGGALTSAGNGDIFVAKFDPTGAHLWSNGFGDENYQWGNGVAVDGFGNVFLTGDFDGTVSFGGAALVSADYNDIYLAKLNSLGVHVWSKGFGDSLMQSGMAVAVETSGNSSVTGMFDGTVNFGGGPLTSAGDDIYVAMFNATGAHVWSKSFGDTLTQYTEAIAVDGTGSAIITGSIEGTVDFGGGPLTSAGGPYDVFVAKFGPPIVGISDPADTRGLAVHSYPNPFNPVTTIIYSVPDDGVADLRVYDVEGRLVKTLVNQSRVAGVYEVSWDGRDRRGNFVGSGIYFVRLECAGKVTTRKITLLK